MKCVKPLTLNLNQSQIQKEQKQIIYKYLFQELFCI